MMAWPRQSKSSLWFSVVGVDWICVVNCGGDEDERNNVKWSTTPNRCGAEGATAACRSQRALERRRRQESWRKRGIF